MSSVNVSMSMNMSSVIVKVGINWLYKSLSSSSKIVFMTMLTRVITKLHNPKFSCLFLLQFQLLLMKVLAGKCLI